jgi:DNA polymerase-3 subunit delta'
MSTAGVEAALEERGTEPKRAALLARLSHGCPGWAITIEADDSLLQKRHEELEKILGIIRADGEERFAYAAQLAAQFSQNRASVYGMIDLWLDYWRDLMLVKLGCHDIISNIDRSAGLVEMARSYRLAQIKGFIESLRAAAEQLRQNANPRLVLEVLMLDIPTKEGDGEDNLATQSSVKYG